MKALNLLPCPRSLKLLSGAFTLPQGDIASAVKAIRSRTAPANDEGYALTIDRRGARIEYREAGGLRAAHATFRQLRREYGRRLPCLAIRDWPDFPRRGVMLDISRGRVPKLETLLQLVEHLADFKINEFQLYTEHTFAYRHYEPVWRDWGALTAAEIRKLDARCRELGIDLVPNQNSFGHLRYWLEYPPLRLGAIRSRSPVRERNRDVREVGRAVLHLSRHVNVDDAHRPARHGICESAARGRGGPPAPRHRLLEY